MDIRIKELIALLIEAASAYYSDGEEIMANHDYDALYDELIALEEETELIFEDSTTRKLGAELSTTLKKVQHENAALSLNKTKNIEELLGWLDGKNGVLSWKMDGLTIILTYENGNLIAAATRGNGEVGEDVTENARHFHGLSETISFHGKLILRVEAVITYSDFPFYLRRNNRFTH